MPLDFIHGEEWAYLIQYPNSLIGLEHLTDIRERTPRRKRDKKGKRVGKKQRKANVTYSKWSLEWF